MLAQPATREIERSQAAGWASRHDLVPRLLAASSVPVLGLGGGGGGGLACYMAVLNNHTRCCRTAFLRAKGFFLPCVCRAGPHGEVSPTKDVSGKRGSSPCNATSGEAITKQACLQHLGEARPKVKRPKSSFDWASSPRIGRNRASIGQLTWPRTGQVRPKMVEFAA